MNTESFAKDLRRRLTPAERRLWHVLRDRRIGGKFRRQVPFGRYVVDFVCHEARLIVEVDGKQHCESVHDRERDAWLRSCGYRVMRFWNHEVLQTPEVVLDTIHAALSPSPPEGEG